MKLSTFVIAALALALPSAASADAFRAQKLKEGRPVSIQAYGSQNPDCLEWTNGCVACVRAEGHTSCSTPGIACTPAGLTCKRMSHTPAQPKP